MNKLSLSLAAAREKVHRRQLEVSREETVRKYLLQDEGFGEFGGRSKEVGIHPRLGAVRKWGELCNYPGKSLQ